MKEGFWYSKYEPNLPMPVPNELAPFEARAIYELIKQKENSAKVTRYRGVSPSRLDASYVGSAEYEHSGWVWPQGFAEHYVLQYRVRPSDAFLKFIGYTK